MDKEALRKQLYEELQSQFEVKLRETKRQKSQVEEELESASEKWRTERRRLNGEIDRLESALAEARDSRRKVADTKGARAPDAQEIAKLQAVADEKLKRAALEWDGERTKLHSEISRLQNGLAELIERSNNPLRASQTAKDQLEGKLHDAAEAKRRAETALVEAKAEWEQEKLKLAGEMVRLRRSAGGKAKGKLPEEEELEKRLSENVRAKEELTKDLEKTRQELSKVREAQAADLKRFSGSAAEIQKLERQVADTRESLSKTHSDEIARERKEAARLQEAHGRELDKARQEVSALKGQASDLQRVTAELNEARAEVQRLERQVAETKNLFSKELAEDLDKQRGETAQFRQQTQLELETTQQEIAKLKEAHAAELHHATVLFEEASGKAQQLERQLKEARGSVAKDGQARTQLDESARSQESLKHELEKSTQTIVALREKQAAELLRMTAQLQESRSEVQQLERRLAETKNTVDSDVVDQLRKQYDDKLQEMIRQKTQLSEELKSASAQLDAERSRFTAAAAAAAQSKPETEKKGKSAKASEAIAVEAIEAEVARVEELVAGISQLIEDPKTELSTVIRKNVERAELSAYMKGILFSIGRGRAL